MEHIVFEAHPAFILICVAVAIAYAWWLYQASSPWPRSLNWILFGLRTVLVFLLSFLLLSPIVKQVDAIFEKPAFIVVHDNSISVRESTDSIFRQQTVEKIEGMINTMTSNGFEVESRDLDGNPMKQASYMATTSDLQSALKKIITDYEGKPIAGVLLISDGIYNSGLSPLFANYTFPIHTLGLGDTTQQQDVVLKDLVYNKIAYQGNKFLLRAEIKVKGYLNETLSVSLLQAGKVLDRQVKNIGNQPLAVVDFFISANEQGIQRYDVQVEIKRGESNARNNRSTAFVEVVEGKKKILVMASAPHPDIKALRAVIEGNPNYDFLLHIPGVAEVEQKYLQPENVDLAVLHQVPDKRGRMRDLFQRFNKSKTSLLAIVGQQTDLNVLTQSSVPLKFEQLPRQTDDVMPVINTTFPPFTLTPEANAVFSGFPPVWVLFAKMIVPASANILLLQKVGNLTTDKPLLWVEASENRKVGVMLADGFWQWRLEEFSMNEGTESFDEVFGKLIQYLSTVEDKSKFKSYPVKQQFSETEAVIFESQVYNDIYEPVYGNRVDVKLTDEAGQTLAYNYTTSPGNSRYQIGGLREGVYRYKATTQINGKEEEVRGQFLLMAQEAELQNLQADFDLLRKLSARTGGSFSKASDMESMMQRITSQQAQATLRTEEKYDALLNLKWVFFILLSLISTEWFLRKYFGSY